MSFLQIKAMYIYYFLLSGTKIKTYTVFKFCDLLFLVLIPILLIFKSINNKKKFKNQDKYIIFVTMFYFLQLLFISYKNLINEITYYIPILIGYFILNNNIKIKKKTYHKLLCTIVIFLISVFFLEKTHTKYSNGIFNNPIGVGIYSLLGLYILDYSKVRVKLKNGLQIFFIGMIFYSNTRGSMVAALIYILTRKGLNYKKVFKYIVSSIFLILFLNFSGIIKIEKILNKYNSKLDLLTGRPKIWEETIKYYFEESVMGSSLGHYNLITTLTKRGYPGNIHNGYLDILFSFGIILGTVIIFSIFYKLIKLVKSSVKYKIKTNQIGILLSIAILSFGESVVFFTRVPIMAIFWITYRDLELELKRLKNSHIISITKNKLRRKHT
ncbi:MAG: O-antigen ligase family protein [Bacilli bacterium]